MGATPLLERATELAALRALLDAARDGDGGGAIVAGPAGIGKSRLLRELVAVAAEREMLVLSARCSELERGFAFGVVGELLGSWGPAAGSGGDLYARLHAAYWELAARAAERPVLITVDDVQWADDESLRWLVYLARRLDGLAAACVLAQRDGEGDAAVLAESGLPIIRPAPLSLSAVRQLAASLRGVAPGPEAAAEWHRRSGGNPFLAGELIRTPAGRPVPDSVERDLQVRLRRLGADARALARAAAVLGPRAELRLSAALAGLDTAPAAAAADRLVAAGLVREVAQLEFVHALIAEAVAATIPEGERSLAHRRAAALLDADGAPAQRIAVHLSAVPPAGDAWAAGILAAAGRDALAAGAPQSAARLLRRALAEPAPEPMRPELLLGLGRAEVAIRDEAAAEHLRAARDGLSDPAQRAQVTQELVSDLRLRGRVPEAVAALRAALTELEGEQRELRYVLEAQLAAAVLGSRETLGLAPAGVADALNTLAGETPGERMMLAAAAFRTGMAGGPATADAVRAARAALQQGLLHDVSAGHQLFVMSLAVLYLTGAIAEAEHWAALGIEAAQRAGSVSGFALVSCFRSEARRQAGRLVEAEADARAATAPGDPRTWPMAAAALGFLVESLVERGALHDAETELAGSVVPAAALETYPLCRIRLARAKLALARGDHPAAITDALAAGEVYTAWDVLSPAWSDWRSTAARALAADGQHDAALRLAAEELRAARAAGVPRAVGLAQLTCGRISGDPAAVADAMQVLAGTDSRLAHAEAMIELGAMQAAGADAPQAIALLEEGMQQAHRCGAPPLVERARAELARLGRRPRRPARRGVEALTAQERRIAALAAGGRSNRQIAQDLFVTLGTVEAHLTRAYQKLEIQGRRQLADHVAARRD